MRLIIRLYSMGMDIVATVHVVVLNTKLDANGLLRVCYL